MMWDAAEAPGLTLASDAVIGSNVTFGAGVTVHEGTVIGAGSAIGDGVVLGKQPMLSASSTVKTHRARAAAAGRTLPRLGRRDPVGRSQFR